MRLPDIYTPYVSYVVFMQNRTESWSLDKGLSHWSLTYVADGSADYEIDGVPYTIKKGQAILMAPNIYRKAKTTGFKICNVDFFAQPEPDGNNVEIFNVVGVSEFVQNFKKLNYCNIAKPEGYQLMMQGYLNLILAQLLYQSKIEVSENPLVKRMKDYIAEFYSHPIRVSEIAEHVARSSGYCGKIFKETEGCSIPRYVNRIRIDAACGYISEGIYKMDEIAQMTGFCDAYHFSKVFKNVMGMSPHNYIPPQLY